MTSWLSHILSLFLILESSCSKLLPVDFGETLRPGAGALPAEARRVFTHESSKRDMVSASMFKVYEKYSKEPQSQRDGNTVRSFKAVPSEWTHDVHPSP